MQSVRQHGQFRPYVVLGVALILTECTTKERIIYVQETDTNSPPVALQVGPQIPGGRLELYPGEDPPRFTVIVSDSDGIEDIAGVVLRIRHVALNRIIARPNSYSMETCAALAYRDFDTIGLQALVSFDYPGLSYFPMVHTQGGLYVGPPLCAFDSECAAFPVIPGNTNGIGTPLTACYTSPFGSWLAHWSLWPPVTESPINIFITCIDVSYVDVAVTVYDAAGDSTTATLPDLRIIYTTDEEGHTEP